MNLTSGYVVINGELNCTDPQCEDCCELTSYAEDGVIPSLGMMLEVATRHEAKEHHWSLKEARATTAR